MLRPETYQLSFAFSPESEQPEPSLPYTVMPGSFARLDGREVGTSRFVHTVRERIVIRSPVDAARHLMDRIFAPFSRIDQEEMWLLLLNSKNRITHEAMLYRGTVNSTQIRMAEVFKEAVRVNSPALLMAHCHPSGDPTPSPEDILVTEQAYAAGQILQIDLLDHIIVGDARWLSLKEKALGFSGLDD